MTVTAPASVRVVCACGTSYELKAEFAGRLVKCPQCGRENRVPAAPSSAATAQADAAFDRDIFLLRQQLMRISEKYDVGDEKGNKIIFVERPAHLLQNLGALLLGMGVLFGGIMGFGALADQLPRDGTVGPIIVIVGMFASIIGGLAIGVALSAKRHVSFYRNDTKREKLMEVLQDKKWQPITATYTVRDARNRPIAKLGKNILYNMFRKRWYIYDPSGRLIYVAKEDSIILSLLRRLLGPLFGFLRTNFIILKAGTEDIVGEFKRKFTILDRYVLDMSSDPERRVDRRIALALGVMLDTGERR
jgi:uncharacterized protein YxjI